MIGTVKAFFLSSMLLVCGCSTTTQLASPIDANIVVGLGPARIVLRSGASHAVRALQVNRDSTHFIHEANDKRLTIATGDIASIHFVRRTQGAAEGLLIGGVGGFAVSYLSLAATHKGGVEGMGWLLVIGGSALGLVGGFTVGVINGHQCTLVFPDQTADAGAVSRGAEEPVH